MTRRTPKLVSALGLCIACGALIRCAVYDGTLLDAASSAGASGANNGMAGTASSGGPSAGAPSAGSGGDSAQEAGTSGESSTAGASASGGSDAGGGTSGGASGGASSGGNAGSTLIAGSGGTSGGASSGGAGAGGSGAGSAGTAGSAVGGGGTGGAPSLCNNVIVGSGTLGSVDDFDDGNAFILVSDGRSGTWIFASDGSGTTTPAPGAATPSAVGEMGLAQRIQGTGLMGAGADLTAELVPPGDCYDASAYRGVNVALKGSGQVELSVLTAQVNAQPTAKQDQYKAVVTLTSAWQDLSFAWSEFHQSGYPGATVLPFDNTKLTGIALTPRSASKPLSFDVTVDNLSLRKKTN